MNHVFVIGEMGSSHDGNLTKAFRLIDEAKACNCDAVKAQYWSNAARLAARRNAPEYLAIYEQYQIPEDWLFKLRRHCDRMEIEFMCTAYLPEDVDVIASVVNRFKIASFEASDLDFVKAHRVFNLPIIASVGMLGEREVLALVPHVDTLLHCVSSYPCPANQANLSAMLWLQRLGIEVGFSDHTGLELTGALAVAHGAAVIEVHFALNTTDPRNPDMAAALSPCSLHHYIRNVRLAERMIGDGVKKREACEAPMSRYQVKA